MGGIHIICNFTMFKMALYEIENKINDCELFGVYNRNRISA